LDQVTVRAVPFFRNLPRPSLEALIARLLPERRRIALSEAALPTDPLAVAP
jgi:hypothetical protein